MQRSQKSDFHLILLSAILLFIEVIWLLMHLQIIPTPFQRLSSKLSQKPAGSVAQSQNELRKRGLNSLIWENARTDEIIYEYDSVLTLSQSTATLHLQEQTEVHLSENTLVTIEPQVIGSASQIRLRFTRGDLRARNPYASTKIESDQWSLDLKQGSEVSLRQTGKEDFEVEVLKGNLKFEKGTDVQALGENQVLKIAKNQISETMALSREVKFSGAKRQRIYSYEDRAHVPVRWTGKADQIQISALNSETQVYALGPQQNSENLLFLPGRYTLRLLKTGLVSEAKEVEVWKAPTLHLLSPFPRDRVKTNESVSFVWTYIPEADQYKLIMTDLKTGFVTEQIAKDHFLQHQFSDENDVEWKVIGLDRDGFEMPSAYSNQIFPRHEPLAAPKLKSPLMRFPASKKTIPSSKNNMQQRTLEPAQTNFHSVASWLFGCLITPANAEEKPGADSKSDFEAVFAWEAVEGADLYTLEVSTTADFRKPILSKKVKKTEYVWSQFPLGIYFWRVASGTTGGRLGAFSEPAKVHLDSPQENSSSDEGVLVRKKIVAQAKVAAALDSQRSSVETRSEKLLSDSFSAPVAAALPDESRYQTETSLTSQEQRLLKDSYLIEWSPLLTNWNLNGENELKVKLNGSTLSAAHLQIEQKLNSEKTYIVDAFFASYHWTVSDPLTYPFQAKQAFIDGRLQILVGDSHSGLLRGGILQAIPVVRRKDLEKIEIQSSLAIGPSVTSFWKLSPDTAASNQFSVLAGSSLFALTNQNQLRYSLLKSEHNQLTIGLRLQEDFVFDQRNFSLGYSAGFTLGIEH